MTNSFKNRVQSTLHFQIKDTKQRNIPWLIDSRRDIGSRALEGEIKGGADFESRKLGVEEERENLRGSRRGHL
jgi:hypothetical protein